jgi:hypothetical protein
LVELLAATAIIAMLTTASLAVVTAVMRSHRAQQDKEHLRPLLADVRRLVEMDLLHARRYQRLRDGFAVETRSALAPVTLAHKHWPAEVIYTVETIDDQRWLIRTQTAGTMPVVREVVGCGITNIDVKEALDEDEADDAEQPEIPFGTWQPAPQAVVVTIRSVSQDNPIIEFILRLPD